MNSKLADYPQSAKIVLINNFFLNVLFYSITSSTQRFTYTTAGRNILNHIPNTRQEYIKPPVVLTKKTEPEKQ